ncbi:Cut9-interacting protein scn1 [Leucoagaricus sp. SymC.cos]|nr:Cut9-interacting protein scn1 [Leucoagaricus sp. SymC.cos]
MTELPSSDILRHVVDVHCHPTDSPSITPESIDKLPITICAMSTRERDQILVRNLAIAGASKIIPCFGYHPWFTYYIGLDPTLSREDHYKRLFLDSLKTVRPEDQVAFDKILPLLPAPRPLSDVLNEMRRNLIDFPSAMVGEVGLDKSVRVAYDYDATPRELTPFNIPLDHQISIIEAQIDLAVELGRNVSVHSVHSPQATIELLDRLAWKHGDAFYRISVDIHSCSLSPDTWKTIERKHPNIFLSLSKLVNGRSAAYKALIAACADDRILVESDCYDINLCTPLTWDLLKTVAEVKKWDIESAWTDSSDPERWGAVRRIEHSWCRFRDGAHALPSRPSLNQANCEKAVGVCFASHSGLIYQDMGF